MHYAGTGPVLLLVPGITSPAITWGFAAERLAARWDVHVLDVRGRGLSERGDLDYSLDAMAEDVVRLAAMLSGAPVTLLGHSMGARIAIRAARRDQARFERLFLVDPPVGGPGRRVYPAPWEWYEDSIRLSRRGCTADEMRPFFPTWTDEQLALRAEWLHSCDLEAVRIAYDGFQTDDIHADLPHLTLPMRLVVAGAAPVIEPAEAEEMATLAPDLDIRTVDGAGHMIPWDDLDGFLGALDD
jgi:N-formylmaleamate deformylase